MLNPCDTAFILTLNAGSSSIKFALFEYDQSLRRIQSGHLNVLGSPVDQVEDHVEDAQKIIIWLKQQNLPTTLIAIGHRVVHGGPNYSTPQCITDELLAELRQLIPLDPQHLPREIALIEAVQSCWPNTQQIACFDTAFHHDLPRIAQLIAIPRRYDQQGIRRYGFHGLSYTFLMEELDRLAGAQSAQGRVILAHLGNGVSLAAVHYGKPVDTSMGFTPTAGVLMGTRSGDLDPGLMCYLMRTEGMDVEQFNQMVNAESGLLGLSEISADMGELLQLKHNDVRAAEAIELFCYQIKKSIGAFAAVLGGLDTLVFAGGIGENVPVIREQICQGLEFLGISLNPVSNDANDIIISAKDAQVVVRIIPTDEELMIALSVLHCLIEN